MPFLGLVDELIVVIVVEVEFPVVILLLIVMNPMVEVALSVTFELTGFVNGKTDLVHGEMPVGCYLVHSVVVYVALIVVPVIVYLVKYVDELTAD